MKSLTLLNKDTNVKLGDTATNIQFAAYDNGEPVVLSQGQTAVFRLKNSFGFVKSINAKSTYGGMIFEIDTTDLNGLIAGSYQVELAVNATENETLVFPDEGFVSFNITTNALNIIGQQLNQISLEDFQKQAQSYVDEETSNLKSNFETYVADIKTGPQGEQGVPGESATISIGTTTTGTPGSSASVTNSGTDSAAVLNFTVPKGETGAAGQAATISIGTTTTGAAGSSASVTNSGDDSAAVLNFTIPQGPQGIQGPQGPEGTMGDYGLFTGWLDLTPYMDFDNVWNTPDSSTYCRYAVTSFNSQNIFWVRVHAKLRDASVAAKYGTTLFTIPSDVRTQYGQGEWNQFNSMYETCGTPCIYSFNKSAGKVVTQGYIPAINGSSTMSAPSGANKDCNLYAWFVL